MTQTATAAPVGDRRAAFDAICPMGFEALRDAYIAAAATPGQFAMAVLTLQKEAGGAAAVIDSETIAKAADEHVWASDPAIRAEFRTKEAFLAYRAGVRAGRIGGRRA
jgi:hypothetical protein